MVGHLLRCGVGGGMGFGLSWLLGGSSLPLSAWREGRKEVTLINAHQVSLRRTHSLPFFSSSSLRTFHRAWQQRPTCSWHRRCARERNRSCAMQWELPRSCPQYDTNEELHTYTHTHTYSHTHEHIYMYSHTHTPCTHAQTHKRVHNL